MTRHLLALPFRLILLTARYLGMDARDQQQSGQPARVQPSFSPARSPQTFTDARLGIASPELDGMFRALDELKALKSYDARCWQ